MTAIPNLSSSLMNSKKISYVSELQRECNIIYQAWLEKEAIEPYVYYKNIMQKSAKQNICLSEVTKKDFLTGNVFSVSGLFLGKTEASFLAHIGSQC
jgi:hypothetical protein